MATLPTFKPIGAPGYGTALRTYDAEIDLAKHLAHTEGEGDSATVVKDTAPLFIIPAGSTILAAKAKIISSVEGTGVDLTVDVGTYAFTADGDVGTAIDADLVLAAAAMANKETGDHIAPASTARAYLTQDVVVVAAAKAVTKIPTQGKLLVSLVTVQ